jgi:hypothetical protein
MEEQQPLGHVVGPQPLPLSGLMVFATQAPFWHS